MFGMRRIVSTLALALAATACWSPNANAAPIVLDNFSVGAGPFGAVTPGPATLQGPIGIGGGISRTISISAPGFTSVGDGLQVGGGLFQFATLNVGTSTTANYTFSPVSLSGANSLGMDFTFIDGGVGNPTTMSMLLTVHTSTGDLTKTVVFPNVSSLTAFNVPLTGLAGVGTLGSTTGIAFTFNNINDPGVDFILTNQNGGIRIFDTPEPASLATFGLIGLVSAVVVRRKLKVGAIVAA